MSSELREEQSCLQDFFPSGCVAEAPPQCPFLLIQSRVDWSYWGRPPWEPRVGILVPQTESGLVQAEAAVPLAPGLSCMSLQRVQFGLYALYSKNKPRSDALMTSYGHTFFKVGA